jgi:hypothetical protein
MMLMWLMSSCAPGSAQLCEPHTREGRLIASPDGVWTAVTCTAEAGAASASTYLRLFDPDLERDWRLSYGDFAASLPIDRHDVLSVIHWSLDGTSVYLTHPTRGSGMIGMGPGGTNLLKLDLSTGQTRVLIADMDTVPQISFAFRGDDEFLLYIPQSYGYYGLNVLNLSSGDVQTQFYSSPELIALGYGEWSPDGRSVILLAQTNRLDYQLLVMNLESGARTIAAANLEGALYPRSWNADGTVDLHSDTGEDWILDVETGILQEESDSRGEPPNIE